MKVIPSLFAVVCSVAALTTLQAAEPFDVVLKIVTGAATGTPGTTDSIAGDSSVLGHVGEIDVASFKLGIMQKGSALAGYTGGGATKSDFKPVTIYKFVDRATPTLFVGCALGTHYKSATLVVSNVAAYGNYGPPQREVGEFFKVVLEDVTISSANQEASTTDGSGNLVETIELNYMKISWYYTAPDGTVVKGGFDLKKNVKF